MLLPLISLLMSQTPADAAKVDKAKPQETAAVVPAEVPKDFTQEAQASAGALFSDGNTSALAASVGGFWQMKYLIHGVRLEAGGGMSSVAQDPDGNPANGFDVPLFDPANRTNTAARFLARYDFFITPNDSIYASGFTFHDSAANLLMRLRADVGYRHFIINVPKHALSVEVGAVYTIDNTPVGKDSNLDGRIDVADETAFEASGGTIGGRFAAAYTNALSDKFAYTGSAEIVPNIFPDVDAPFEVARQGSGDNTLGFGEATIITLNNTLTFNLSTSLGVGGTVGLLIDAGAIDRRNAYTNYDLATTVQLTYKLF